MKKDNLTEKKRKERIVKKEDYQKKEKERRGAKKGKKRKRITLKRRGVTIWEDKEKAIIKKE